MDEEQHYDFQMNVTIENIKILHYSVERAIEVWAGGDPDEQMDLFQMRDTLRRMILDYTFMNM